MYSEKQLKKVADGIFRNRKDEVLHFDDSGKFLTPAEYNRIPKEQREVFKHTFKNPFVKAKEEKAAKPTKPVKPVVTGEGKETLNNTTDES